MADLKSMSAAELRAELERKRNVVPIRSPTAPAFSEEAMALYFAQIQEGRLRYIPAWGQWKHWDGRRWAHDEKLYGLDRVREICRQTSALYAEVAKGPAGPKGIASSKTANSVLSLARSDARLVATAGDWDTQDYLLNTPGGTIDLVTMQVLPHNPADHLTKITAVAPGGGCPMWKAFLKTITKDDDDLTGYLQRVCGYALTGDTREHAMFFGYGTGANGKSVLLATVSGIVGDYHRATPIETFTATHNDRHPTEIANLHGARLVTAVETEEGRRWAESRIKALTGGDKISARFMRQDLFEFMPRFKLFIAGNHKPGLRSVDEAIRRRFNLIPFAVTIAPENRDSKLTDKLRVEWPGILQWMLDGCRDWQQGGLRPAKVVVAATDEYFSTEDALATWIDECCIKDVNAKTQVRPLFESWFLWSSKAGEHTGTEKNFSNTLEARGYQKSIRDGRRQFAGLALKPVASADQDEPSYYRSRYGG